MELVKNLDLGLEQELGQQEKIPGFSVLPIKEKVEYIKNFCQKYLMDNYAIYNLDAKFTIVFYYSWTFGLSAMVQNKEDNTAGFIDANTSLGQLGAFIGKYDMPFSEVGRLVVARESEKGLELTEILTKLSEQSALANKK